MEIHKNILKLIFLTISILPSLLIRLQSKKDRGTTVLKNQDGLKQFLPVQMSVEEALCGWR